MRCERTLAAGVVTSGSVVGHLRRRGAGAGRLPALAPLEVPPLPGQGLAEAEAGALVGEPVGGGPVADVDRQALHVHRPVGREDPPQRLLERSPLGDLGLEQRRLLLGGPEPGGDRELVAGVGGLGLRPPERVDQAGVEAGGRRRRGGGGRRGGAWRPTSRRRASALAPATSRAPRRAAGTATSTPRVARRRRCTSVAGDSELLGDGGHRSSVRHDGGRPHRPSGWTRGRSSSRRAPSNDGGAPGHPADVGRDPASVPCRRGRLVATTPARRPGPARRRRRRRGVVHGVPPVPPAGVVAEAAGDLRGRRDLDGRHRSPCGG